MPDHPSTIYDVARQAGVSIATVSRVMSGGSVSRASREKVEAAMAALRYAPSPSATHRAEPKLNHRIALVISDLSNPYYALLASGAEDEARRNGYSLLLYVSSLGQDADPKIIEELMRQQPDGAILVGSIIENNVSGQMLSTLRRLQQTMPLAVIGPLPTALPCIHIASDLSLSVRKSLAHLYAMGHRRIAFIGGSNSVASSHIRESAFFSEMARLGLPADPAQHVETGYTPADGETCIVKLFMRTPPEQRPTAIIAINDLVALGAMRQLQRMNLRVPEDVALIGCDNQFFTPFLNPPLTTVDLHPADHGRHAVSMLLAARHGGSGMTCSQIRECSLIVRESCGAGILR